jgi:hypothetical protein
LVIGRKKASQAEGGNALNPDDDSHRQLVIRRCACVQLRPGHQSQSRRQPGYSDYSKLSLQVILVSMPCFKSFLAIDHAVVRRGPQPSVIDQNVNNSLSGFLVTNATRPALIDFDRMNRFSRRIGVEPCE